MSARNGEEDTTGEGSVFFQFMQEENQTDYDDSSSVGDNKSRSLSVASDTSSICSEEFSVLESAYDVITPIPSDVEKKVVQSIDKASMLDECNFLQCSSGGDASYSKPAQVLRVPYKKGNWTLSQSDPVCNWGLVSIRGKRSEMEDAATVVPQLVGIPLQMLHGDCFKEVKQDSSHSTVDFFGVYDGHGGSQVADYCRERVHSALVKEIETLKSGLNHESCKDNWKTLWEKAFRNCFIKVDAEVGGDVVSKTVENDTEPAAAPPETVGSTAVVAVVCSSHIIVANCGDSRAVVCRGKEPMPLSVDHKPDREDEYARIEAAGGKVIQWNGNRIFGVLAMSRSIGDRYLKPWVIPEPEVVIVPRNREDECLILASDGLWDVMTNGEACEKARRRILLWYKRNDTSTPSWRGEGVDPACQAAAEYLSKLALQKGSKDNITVIVVDLNEERKFKNTT